MFRSITEDGGESYAFDSNSAAVIRLSEGPYNGMVLYLREISSYLAVICLLKEETFQKEVRYRCQCMGACAGGLMHQWLCIPGLLDANVDTLKRALKAVFSGPGTNMAPSSSVTSSFNASSLREAITGANGGGGGGGGGGGSGAAVGGAGGGGGGGSGGGGKGKGRTRSIPAPKLLELVSMMLSAFAALGFLSILPMHSHHEHVNSPACITVPFQLCEPCSADIHSIRTDHATHRA